MFNIPDRLKVVLLISLWAILGVVLSAPLQVVITLGYKFSLVLLGVTLGWWVDFFLFPYARPQGYLVEHWKKRVGFTATRADHVLCPGYEMVFAVACIRRAAVMVGVAFALAFAL